jgi:hypothetical protein
MGRFPLGIDPSEDACLAFAPDGRFLAVGGNGPSGVISLWDLLPGRTRLPGHTPALIWRSAPLNESITALALGPSCAALVVSTVSSGIRVIELRAAADAAIAASAAVRSGHSPSPMPHIGAIVRTHALPMMGPSVVGDAGAPRRGGRSGAGKWSTKSIVISPDGDTLFFLESSERGAAAVTKWQLCNGAASSQSALLVPGPDRAASSAWTLLTVHQVSNTPLTCMTAHFPSQAEVTAEGAAIAAKTLQPAVHLIAAGTLALGGSSGAAVLIDADTLMPVSRKLSTFNDRPVSAIAILPGSGLVISASPFVNALDRMSPNYGCVSINQIRDSRNKRSVFSSRCSRGLSLLTFFTLIVISWLAVARWAQERRALHSGSSPVPNVNDDALVPSADLVDATASQPPPPNHVEAAPSLESLTADPAPEAAVPYADMDAVTIAALAEETSVVDAPQFATIEADVEETPAPESRIVEEVNDGVIGSTREPFIGDTATVEVAADAPAVESFEQAPVVEIEASAQQWATHSDMEPAKSDGELAAEIVAPDIQHQPLDDAAYTVVSDVSPETHEGGDVLNAHMHEEEL